MVTLIRGANSNKDMMYEIIIVASRLLDEATVDNGHFGTSHFVLCREVVLLPKPQCISNIGERPLLRGCSLLRGCPLLRECPLSRGC